MSVTDRVSPLIIRVWAAVFSIAAAQMSLLGFSKRPTSGRPEFLALFLKQGNKSITWATAYDYLIGLDKSTRLV